MIKTPTCLPEYGNPKLSQNDKENDVSFYIMSVGGRAGGSGPFNHLNEY